MRSLLVPGRERSMINATARGRLESSWLVIPEASASELSGIY